MDILCIGQLAADILVKPIDSVDYGVDTKLAETIQVKNGGDAMNTAVCLAKLGNITGFCGRIGDDSFGNHLLSVFNELNIETRYLKVIKGGNTTAALVCINQEGERAFFYYGGSNDDFCADDVSGEAVSLSKIVHVGGTYTMPNFDGGGAAEIFKKAQDMGKITSMDCTYDTKGKWLETIRPALKYLDFFMPSLNEAKHIAGYEEPEKQAKLFRELGVKNVIIKLGSRGCFVDSGDGGFVLPAFNVPVVDTTGAGDSFVAGFLTGLNKGWDLNKCAEFAAAVAAHCIGKLGATDGVAGFDETMEFIKNAKN